MIDPSIIENLTLAIGWGQLIFCNAMFLAILALVSAKSKPELVSENSFHTLILGRSTLPRNEPHATGSEWYLVNTETSWKDSGDNGSSGWIHCKS